MEYPSKLIEGEPAEVAAIGGTAGVAVPDNKGATGQPAAGAGSPGQKIDPATGAVVSPTEPTGYHTSRGFVPATPQEMAEKIRQANQRIAELEQNESFAKQLLERAVGKPAEGAEPPDKESQSLEDYIRDYGDHPVVKELVAIKQQFEAQRQYEATRINAETEARGQAIFTNVLAEELPKAPELQNFPFIAGLIQAHIPAILEEKIRQVEVAHMYDSDKTAAQREKWIWANDNQKVAQIVREAIGKARSQVQGYELARYKAKSEEVAAGLEAGKKAAVLGGGGQPPVVGQEPKTEKSTGDRIKDYLAQREAEAARIAREGLSR